MQNTNQGFGTNFVEYKGLRLPPRPMRLGSMPQKPDETYVKYAEGSVKLLEKWAGASRESKILDIGSGPGRLLIGMQSRWGGVERYCGMDVSSESIQWAQQYLADGERIEFVQLDILSERYNPKGRGLRKGFDFPTGATSYNVAVLFSVFSHMWLRDITVYLRALHNVLSGDGKVFCTLFVEEDVPDEQENPSDYLANWSGPLHCIRIDKGVFENSASEEGWQVEKFIHRAVASGQSIYVLTKI